MKEKYFNNLLKLIIFMEFLLQRKIKVLYLNNYQNLVQTFVSDLAKLYNPNIMLSGVHELLHLIKVTKEFGPINLNNCFVYEELNRKIVRMINGTDLIGEEFLKTFSTLQTLGSFLNNSKNNNDIINYARDNYIIRTSNKKCINKFKKKIKIIDCKQSSKIETNMDSIKQHFKRDVNISMVSILFNQNGVRFNGLDSITKFNDGYFKTSSDKLGCIDFFFVEDNEIYVYAKSIFRLASFKVDQYESNMCLCCVSKSNNFITKLNEIDKVFGLSFIETKNMVYISTTKTSHLFS